MAYLPSARKWRPKTFDEIVGQNHIIKPFKNSIINQTVAQGFLFSGPRGVGKTSAARILAKTLNCENAIDENNNFNPVCCNECSNCMEISSSSSLDVYEIDGASNRGIDQIRELRDNVRYSPNKSRFKIYIIDEVHMLTDQAFNALLKTLEEPPSHVKFIFATTEPHKVKDTIRSRCQHYAFRRISISDIANQLLKITESLGISAEKEAVAAIAKAADGSMRDSQSILDQIIAYSGGDFSLEDVRKVLGIAGEEQYKSFMTDIHKKDIAALLMRVKMLIEEGIDLASYATGLIEFIRNLVLIKSVNENSHPLIDLTDNQIKEIIGCKELFSHNQLIEIINLLIEMNKELKSTTNAQFLMESYIFKLVRYESFVSIANMIRRLDMIEKHLSGPNASLKMKSTPVSSARNEDNTAGSRESEDIGSSRASKPDSSGSLTGFSGKSSVQFAGIDESDWQKIIKDIEKHKKVFGTILRQVLKVELAKEKSSIVITVNVKLHYEQLNNKENKKVLEETLKNTFNQDIKIKIKKLEQEKNSHTNAVENAISLFGGKIIE